MIITFRFIKLLVCCLGFITVVLSARAQPGANPNGGIKITMLSPVPRDSIYPYHISVINIRGNKKTKNYIILRQLSFTTGDTILAGNLKAALEQARRQVYNTSLFTEVNLDVSEMPDGDINLDLGVKEKWYLYPAPQFQLVDRNFNEWINRYNADLERVIYGVKFEHYNLSGRNDRLRIYLLNGYARNLSVSYVNPFSNRNLNEGWGIGAGFTQQREVSFRTNYYNRLINYRNNGFVRTTLTGSASYLIRRGLFRTHTFSGLYTHYNVTDSLVKYYNPEYYNSTSGNLGFTDIGYQYLYLNTNNNAYPLTGSAFAGKITKRGFGITGGINMTALDFLYRRYLPHGHNWYSSLESFAKLKLPFDQPYINRRSLGYNENYLRGLENYVIDGTAAAVTKYTLRKKLLSFKLESPLFKKILPAIPFSFYGKTYADAGYNYIKPQYDTRLNNRFLYTGGFGLDILTIYDINFSLEYSFNQLGENGLFLHAKGGF
ncbi:MAG: POTRA domain-containing protein [Ferruginibacter sp.]